MLQSLCVFCGAASGRDPRFAAAARQLGGELGRRGIALVWGAGRVGLMGEVADATLAAGGRLVGVIPGFLRTAELCHPAIRDGDLHVTEDLFERKRKLIELADAFAILPGGLGTLDELVEVVALAQLKRHAKPCALLDVAGFFAPLLAHLRGAVAAGFLDARHVDALRVHGEVAPLLDELARLAAPARAPE
jgi:uncharacterized protein (TIGR00730 family)